MSRRVLLTLSVGVGLLSWAGPASAFWERSQLISCADARTQAERERHRCWELLAYADPGWPRFAEPGLVLEEGAVLAPPRVSRRHIFK